MGFGTDYDRPNERMHELLKNFSVKEVEIIQKIIEDGTPIENALQHCSNVKRETNDQDEIVKMNAVLQQPTEGSIKGVVTEIDLFPVNNRKAWIISATSKAQDHKKQDWSVNKKDIALTSS